MTDTFQLPSLELEQYTLDNGLRVVLNQDESVPVVSVAVYYDVGSRNEREGRTGFAHLFEHMMFQGSENVAESRAFSIHHESRRHDERHDFERAHELLRDFARQSIAARAVARIRPDAVARRDAGKSRQPARSRQGRKTPALRQSALRAGFRSA